MTSDPVAEYERILGRIEDMTHMTHNRFYINCPISCPVDTELLCSLIETLSVLKKTPEVIEYLKLRERRKYVLVSSGGAHCGTSDKLVPDYSGDAYFAQAIALSEQAIPDCSDDADLAQSIALSYRLEDKRCSREAEEDILRQLKSETGRTSAEVIREQRLLELEAERKALEAERKALEKAQILEDASLALALDLAE